MCDGGFLNLPLKALKCPVCGERVAFKVTNEVVKNAVQFPVPFKVIHGDHSFTVHLDSGLLISRVSASTNDPPPVESP